MVRQSDFPNEVNNPEYKAEVQTTHPQYQIQSLGAVPYEKVQRMLDSVAFHFKDEPERLKDLNLTFEYIIASCFPSAYADMRRSLADAQTMGYIQCLRDLEDKSEN